MKAIWHGTILAESDDTVVVENNCYFPADALKGDHFKPSATRTHCPWKGTAHYYSIEVNGDTNADAAWYYPNPEPEAEQIRDRVAFWNGIEIVA